MVYGFLESNITVNNISVTENRFTIRGSFSKKTSFDNLLEKLKGRDGIDREINSEYKKDTFPGSKFYDFKITGLNKWK